MEEEVVTEFWRRNMEMVDQMENRVYVQMEHDAQTASDRQFLFVCQLAGTKANESSIRRHPSTLSRVSDGYAMATEADKPTQFQIRSNIQPVNGISIPRVSAFSTDGHLGNWPIPGARLYSASIPPVGHAPTLAQAISRASSGSMHIASRKKEPTSRFLPDGRKTEEYAVFSLPNHHITVPSREPLPPVSWVGNSAQNDGGSTRKHDLDSLSINSAIRPVKELGISALSQMTTTPTGSLYDSYVSSGAKIMRIESEQNIIAPASPVHDKPVAELKPQEESLSTPHAGLCRLRRWAVRRPARGCTISGCVERHGLWTKTTREHDMEIASEFALTTRELSPVMPTFVACLMPRPRRQKSICIISCYSPHMGADDSELDAFYDQLEEVIRTEKLEKRALHRPKTRRSVVYDENILNECLSQHLWRIDEDPTKDYELLLEGLQACADAASLTQRRSSERISTSTRELLSKRRSLRLDPNATHLERLIADTSCRNSAAGGHTTVQAKKNPRSCTRKIKYKEVQAGPHRSSRTTFCSPERGRNPHYF
ncbi:hypothetical protein OSTOST_04654 [Ostertagia ostertagi]